MKPKNTNLAVEFRTTSIATPIWCCDCRIDTSILLHPLAILITILHISPAMLQLHKQTSHAWRDLVYVSSKRRKSCVQTLLQTRLHNNNALLYKSTRKLCWDAMRVMTVEDALFLLPNYTKRDMLLIGFDVSQCFYRCYSTSQLNHQLLLSSRNPNTDKTTTTCIEKTKLTRITTIKRKHLLQTTKQMKLS